MIILAVRRRSWRELDSGSFGGGLFWTVQYIICLYLIPVVKNIFWYALKK